jgi:SAM-dependent methyltransferase
MTSFSAKWLALREPYDQLARSTTVLDAVAAAFHDRRAISVVDLACGTGATLRAIASHLPALQAWRLVDNDLGLLAQAAVLARPPDRNVEARPVDLVRDLELALDGAIDLITTSALLDLVSADWLERLAVEAAARRLPVYAALTYQGRATLAPAEPFDLEIVAAVNRHQRRDKGFGPALGPEAALAALRSFERVGYTVVTGSSDWVFGPEDRDIQLEVLAGFAGAAADLDDLPADAIAAWLARRRNLVEEGQSSMRVGHIDFLAIPTGRR